MNDDEDVGRILEDWHRRLARGAVEDPEAVIQAHPEHADALRAAFEGLLDAATRPGEIATADAPAPTTLPASLAVATTAAPALTTHWSLEGVASRGVARAAAEMPEDAVTTLARADQVPLDGENEGALVDADLLPVLALGSPGVVPRVRIRLLALDGTLAEAIAEAERDPSARSRVLGAIAVLADTLDRAHAVGVAHGALDPMDVALGANGEVVIRGYGRTVAPLPVSDLQALSSMLAKAIPESEAPDLAALAYRLASASAEDGEGVKAGEVANALRRFLEARAAEAVAAARRDTIRHVVGSARAFGGGKALSALREAIAECEGLRRRNPDDADAGELHAEAESLRKELEAEQAALLERHRLEAETAERTARDAAVEETESRRERDLGNLEQRFAQDARSLERRLGAALRSRRTAMVLAWTAAVVAAVAAVALLAVL